MVGAVTRSRETTMNTDTTLSLACQTAIEAAKAEAELRAIRTALNSIRFDRSALRVGGISNEEINEMQNDLVRLQRKFDDAFYFAKDMSGLANRNMHEMINNR